MDETPTLVLRLKNLPDSESESDSDLSELDIKQNLKRIDKLYKGVICQLQLALSPENKFEKIKLLIQQFLTKTIPILVQLQKDIKKMILSRKLVDELHRIFLDCTRSASIYICNLKKLLHDKEKKEFQKIPTFIKITLLKYNSLILLFPLINWSITKNCTDLKTIQNLMDKFIFMLINFGKKNK